MGTVPSPLRLLPPSLHRSHPASQSQWHQAWNPSCYSPLPGSKATQGSLLHMLSSRSTIQARKSYPPVWCTNTPLHMHFSQSHLQEILVPKATPKQTLPWLLQETCVETKCLPIPITSVIPYWRALLSLVSWSKGWDRKGKRPAAIQRREQTSPKRQMLLTLTLAPETAFCQPTASFSWTL